MSTPHIIQFIQSLCLGGRKRPVINTHIVDETVAFIHIKLDSGYGLAIM